MADKKDANKKRKISSIIVLIIFLLAILVLLFIYFLEPRFNISELIFGPKEEPSEMVSAPKLDVKFKRDFPISLDDLREPVDLPIKAGEVGRNNPFSSF